MGKLQPGGYAIIQIGNHDAHTAKQDLLWKVEQVAVNGNHAVYHTSKTSQKQNYNYCYLCSLGLEYQSRHFVCNCICANLLYLMFAYI